MSMALELKTSIPKVLERELESGKNWEVELNAHSLELRKRNNWDYLVYLTDLPKFENDEPLVSSLNARHGSAVIVLPSLGFVRRKRLRRAVMQVLAALHGVGDPYLTEDGELDPRADPFSVERRIDAKEVDDDAFQTTKGLRGRVLLLLGMVRSNRPWRLVPRLSSAMAAALATGAFGVFYTSIWSMADQLLPQRLATISVLSILVMGTWLVLHNGLWETPVGSRHTEKRVVYNVATLATIFLAILLMYLVLFAVILTGALVIIDAKFLAMELGHDVGFAEYVNLSWLAASLGTIAGAVGSSLDDEESVRKATSSQREFERRQITVDKEEDEDKDE